MPATATVPSGVSEPQPAKSLDEALGRARSYLDTVARSIVSDSYPEEAEPTPAPEPPVTPAEEPAEEPAAPGEETPPAEPEVPPGEQPPAQEEEEPPAPEPEAATLPPEVQEAVNRRIGKEVAKTKAEREAKAALEAQLATLKAEMEQLKAAPAKPAPPPVSDNPLASITDAAKLEAEKARAQKAMDDAVELLERLEDDPDEVAEVLRRAQIPIRDEEGEYSQKGMKRFLKAAKNNASRVVSQFVPARMDYLNRQAQAQARAIEMVPALAESGSEQTKLFNSIVADFPTMKADPNWPIFAMVQMVGLAALKQGQAKNTGKPAPAKIPAKPKATSAPAKAADAEMAELRKRMLAGDREARVALLKKIIE